MCIKGYIPQTRSGILLTLCLFFVIWFLNYASFMSLEFLQSSIHGNVGITTISVVYGFKAISSLFGPLLVNHLTPKWTLVTSFCLQTLFIAANFYPAWYVMYIAGALMGLAHAQMWICFGLYTTVLGIYYAAATKQNKGATLSKFNGIMGATTPIAITFGNLVSSLVFKYVSFNDDEVSANTTELPLTTEIVYKTQKLTDYNDNATENPWKNILMSEGEINLCNANYCPYGVDSENSTTIHPSNSHQPDRRVFYVLLIVLGSFNVFCIILTVLTLRNIPKQDTQSGAKIKRKACFQVLYYIKAFFNVKYLLLIPSIGYFYLLISLTGSTFMKGYITCTFGVEHIGFVAMTLGISCCIMTYISGLIGQCVHRNYIFLTVFIVVLITLGILMLWELIPFHYVMLHVVAGLIGASVGINVNQFSAFMGDVFTDTKTEVFSFFNFFAGISMAAGFYSTNYLCARHQIFLLLGVMILSFVTFSILSIQIYRGNQREANEFELPEIITIHQKQPMMTSSMPNDT